MHNVLCFIVFFEWVILDGSGWFWVVLGDFGWFWVIPGDSFWVVPLFITAV